MGSFWGEKLGTAPPPPPRQVINPNYVPRGMGNDDQSMQRAVNDYVSRLPGAQMNPQLQPSQFQQQPQYQPDPLDPEGEFKYAVRSWQGREGAQETARIGACPHCGSNNYFARSTGSVINTQSGTSASPRPECFECGYPTTQGALGNNHANAGAAGPAVAARQGATPSAPMGSIARLSATN